MTGRLHHERLLELCIRLSMEAGGAILKVYEGDFSVKQKEDASPLTQADLASNNIIVRVLSDTGIPLLSEEEREVPYELRSRWQYLWLIDPLDGTKEFISRNGEFTVNIALIKEGVPVLGVIYAPAKDLLYYALRGQGAYKRERGLEMRLVPQVKDKNVIRIVGSRSHHTKETEDFIAGLRASYRNVEFHQAGSSLKFCLIAEGRADIYPRFGPTMEWDTAAGQAILEETGGKVVDAEQELPLRYNKRVLKNPAFIAKGRGIA